MILRVSEISRITWNSAEQSTLGKSQLATELTLGADEFDYYHIPCAPLTLGFFLREFNVGDLACSNAAHLSNGTPRLQSLLRTP